MKIKFKMLFFFTVVSFLFSCATVENKRESGDGLWAGVYTGIIPAADASGIDVLLFLNTDKTYNLRYRYIDKSYEAFECSGRLKWDPVTSIITLGVNNSPPYYKVENGSLRQLDIFGNIITGQLAGNYVLKKVYPLNP